METPEIKTAKDWYNAIEQLGKKYGVPVGEDTRKGTTVHFTGTSDKKEEEEEKEND